MTEHDQIVLSEDEYLEYWKERDRLKALNAELVEALERIPDALISSELVAIKQAALAKARKED